MLYLICYDVCTSSLKGKRRLRHVSKECENFGVRVQNSVFECELSYEQFLSLQHSLLSLIDENEDSLRFYTLGKHGRDKVVHLGSKTAIDVTAPLIL